MLTNTHSKDQEAVRFSWLQKNYEIAPQGSLSQKQSKFDDNIEKYLEDNYEGLKAVPDTNKANEDKDKDKK